MIHKKRLWSKVQEEGEKRESMQECDVSRWSITEASRSTPKQPKRHQKMDFFKPGKHQKETQYRPESQHEHKKKEKKRDKERIFQDSQANPSSTVDGAPTPRACGIPKGPASLPNISTSLQHYALPGLSSGDFSLLPQPPVHQCERQPRPVRKAFKSAPALDTSNPYSAVRYRRHFFLFFLFLISSFSDCIWFV